MNRLHILVLAAFLPFVAAAQDATTDPPQILSQTPVEPTPQDATAEDATTFGPISASETTLEQYLWLKRPIVVFADTPNDPAYQLQMTRIMDDLGSLEERDVVIITDTDPAARTSVRQRLRPRGFSLVLMEKDGEVKRRIPAPRAVRDIVHVIDRFPLRRQEMLEQRPAGR